MSDKIKEETTVDNRKQHPLVGRAVHMQDEGFKGLWQGEVIADCGDGYFLVHLFEHAFSRGGAVTEHILHLRQLAGEVSGTTRFVFFESLEQAIHYDDKHEGRRCTQEHLEAERYRETN